MYTKISVIYLLFSLKVYDGYSVNQQTLLQLRGTIPEDSSVTSTGQLMLVHFQSDVGVTDSGFRAHYISLTTGLVIII